MRKILGMACVMLICGPAYAETESSIIVNSACDMVPKAMPRLAGKSTGQLGDDPGLWLPKLEPVIKAPLRAAGPCLR